jgi:hypothetical protein
MTLLIEELLPRVQNAGAACKAECSPWLNASTDCMFNNPSVSDPLTLLSCLCANPKIMQAAIIRCSSCIQTIDDSDPEVKMLKNWMQQYSETDICETFTSKLDAGISLPIGTSGPTASESPTLSTASDARPTVDSSLSKDSTSILLFELHSLIFSRKRILLFNHGALGAWGDHRCVFGDRDCCVPNHTQT